MGQRDQIRRGVVCGRCGAGFRPDEFPTRLYVAEDPHGGMGLSGTFHDACAAPVWGYAAPQIEQPAAQ